MKLIIILYSLLMAIASGISIAWTVAPGTTTIATITGASLLFIGLYTHSKLRK